MTNETRILAAVTSILMVAAVSAASAQTVDITARVPFEFRVGGDTMPRDVYRISRAHAGSSTLMLRGGRSGVFILARHGSPYTGADNPQLVFHRIGNQFFLREVRLLGSGTFDLPETRAEREALERIANGAPAAVQRIVILAGR